MAFKTFAPGVLTSSDVNTFLMRQAVITCTSSTQPASPSEGMTIYETDTDLYKVYDGSSFKTLSGLAPVAEDDGSTVSSLAFNDVFTTAFTFYRIVLRVSSSDGNGYIFRLRASGSDDTNTSYDQATLSMAGSTVTGATTADSTGWSIVCSQNTELHTFDILDPAIAFITTGQAFCGNTSGGAPEIRLRYLQHDDGTAFDGFSLTAFTSGQTINATVRIYGYR